MTRVSLPPGIDADDLVGLDGWTYVAYQDLARGLVVERYLDDPTRRVLIFMAPRALGCAALTWLAGEIWLAYRMPPVDPNDPNAPARVFTWSASVGIRERGACLGSYPFCWSDAVSGALAVQRPPGCFVDLVDVIAGAVTPTGLQGAGTGLARATTDASGDVMIVTYDGARGQGLDAPHWSGNSIVSQHSLGGILATIGPAAGVLERYRYCGRPRVARTADGARAIVYQVLGSRGALPLTLLTGVTAADLWPVEHLVTPLDPRQPTLAYSFTFKPDAPGAPITEPPGNAVLVIQPTLAQLQALRQGGYRLILDQADVAALAVPTDTYDYFACNLEGVADVGAALERAHTAAHAFGKGLVIYCASPAPDAVIRGARKGDVLSSWVYHDPGERLPAFEERDRLELDRLDAGAAPGVIVATIAGVVQRYVTGGGGQLSLTSDEAEQALAVHSRVVARKQRTTPAGRVGVSVFRLGRADVNPSIVGALEAFMGDVPLPALIAPDVDRPPIPKPTPPSPKPQPIPPAPTPTPDPEPEPEPPMKTFASEQEKNDYCNALAPIIAVRTRTPLGKPAANTGRIVPQGQEVWQSFDQWYAVQPPMSIPPSSVMLDLTVDRMNGAITDEQLRAVLKFEVPLR